ncbi:hypothetical protein Vretimale_8070 [Volvox reticuliferus]|uniref:Uncharacterized protein n=1 Tax=Volvox reticuliferus TaxID=1737510 RepID=A0A8J4C4L0_9CHLO|nr:hypothetical protein Vretifemale_5160 [Volvox reticuliferus]GIM03318.1 hypothetical protein Vretimale_8070 [Volvox reticuliferus]
MQARSSFQDSFIAHNSADSPLLGVGCEDFGSSSDNDRLRTRHGNAQGRASVPIHSIGQLRATSMDGERPNAGPSNSGHGLKCSGRWVPNSSCCAHPQDDFVSYDYRSRRVPLTSPCVDGVPPSSFAETFTLVYGVDAPPSALPQDMSKTKNSSRLAAADINAPVTCLSKAFHRSRSSSPSRTFRPLLAMAPQAPSASESSVTLHTSLDPSSEQAPIAGKEITGFLPPSSSSTSNHPLFDGTSATAAAATAAAGTSGLDLPVCHRLRAVPNAILKFTWGNCMQSMARATSSDPPRLAAGFDLGPFHSPRALHEVLRGQAAAATGRPTHLGRRSFATATSPADGGRGGGLSDCLAWRPQAPGTLLLGLCNSSRAASRTHEVSGRLPPCRMSAGLPHVRMVGASATDSMTRPPRLRPECSFDWGLQLPPWEEVPKEGGPHSTAQFEERMADMNREAWNPRPFRPVGTPAALLGRWLTAATANGELSAMTLAAAAGRGPGYVAAKLRTNIAVCDPRVNVPPPARAGALLPTDVTMPAAAANRPGAEAGNRTDVAITEPAAAAAAATARATDAAAVEHSAQATEPLPSAPVRLQAVQAVEVASHPASTSPSPPSPPSPPLPQQQLEVEMMEPGDPVPQLHESFSDADATATVVAPQVPSVPSTKLRTIAASGAGKEGRARPNPDSGRTNQTADEPTWAEKYEETAMPLDCTSRERGLAEPAVGALLATLARLAAEGLTGRGGGGAGAGAAAPDPGPITPDAGADPAAGSIPRCRDVQGGEGSREGSSARSRDGSGGGAAADGVGGISCTSVRKRRLGEMCPEPDPSSIPHPILRRELLLSAIEEQLQLKPLSQAIGVAQD